MNFITQLISNELIHALGWTVLHSLWQAAVVALVMALLLLLLQKHTAIVRYLTANVALMTVLILAIVTFFRLYQPTEIEFSNETTIILDNGSVMIMQNTTSSSTPFLQEALWTFIDYFNQHLPLIVTIWVIGLAFFLLRMIGGLAYVRMLRYRNTNPLPETWQHKLQELAQKVPVYRPVALLESAMVRVPMVIGYLKPVILLPIGTVNGLAPQQVEAILAHELAHIYRNDYLLNILQSFIEMLFYFNPAVWWISANIRAERENCCDDIAVQLCGDSLSYAKALVSLQEMSKGAPAFAMTFSNNKNQLLHRVQRILNQPQSKSNIMEKIAATSLLLIAIVYLSVQANTPAETTTNLFRNAQITYLDTIPNLPKGNIQVSTTHEGKKVKVKIEDGVITNLNLDGKKIPKEEYENYEEYISNLIQDIPAPPAPPTPPTPPTPPVPAVPSAPPAPPAPSSGTIIELHDEELEQILGSLDFPDLSSLQSLGGLRALSGLEGLENLKGLERLNEMNFADTIPEMKALEEEMKQLQIEMEQQQAEMAARMEEVRVEMEKMHQEKQALHKAQLRERMIEVEKEIESQMREQEQQMQKAMLQREKALQQAAKARLQAEEVAEEARRQQAKQETIRKTLVEELAKDGLIDDDRNFRFELSDNQLIVDGEKQPEAIFQKYKKLYQDVTGTLGKNVNFVIETRSGGQE